MLVESSTFGYIIVALLPELVGLIQGKLVAQSCVDTIFFGTCQFGSKRPMENGLALDQRRREEHAGPWAKRGVAAEGDMEGAGEAMLASYLFYFILFKLGKFVL